MVSGPSSKISFSDDSFRLSEDKQKKTKKIDSEKLIERTGQTVKNCLNSYSTHTPSSLEGRNIKQTYKNEKTSLSDVASMLEEIESFDSQALENKKAENLLNSTEFERKVIKRDKGLGMVTEKQSKSQKFGEKLEEIQETNDKIAKQINEKAFFVSVRGDYAILSRVDPENSQHFQSIVDKYKMQTPEQSNVSSKDVRSLVQKMGRREGNKAVLSQELLKKHPHLKGAVYEDDLPEELRRHPQKIGRDNLPAGVKLLEIKAMSQEERKEIESLVENYLNTSIQISVLEELINQEKASEDKPQSKKKEPTPSPHPHLSARKTDKSQEKEPEKQAKKEITDPKMLRRAFQEVILGNQRIKQMEKNERKKEEEEAQELHKHIKKIDENYQDKLDMIKKEAIEKEHLDED